MVDTVKLVATAQRLIKKNGRSVSFVKLDNETETITKPWNGPLNSRRSPSKEITIDAVFVSPGAASKLGMVSENSDLLANSKSMMIVSPGVGEDLSVYDQVVDEGVYSKIQGMEVLKPGTEVLLAFVGISR